MSEPTFDLIPEQALAWHRAGTGAALATVIETWGSAPRRVGSQLAINGQGEIVGSVSGGCVEGAVIVDAIESIAMGDARELEFGVSDGDAFAVGLACGGTIRILIEPVGAVLPEQMLADLISARAARQPVAYDVDLATNTRALHMNGFTQRFAMDRSGFEEGTRRFIAIHNPPLRMIVVGAVHIAQALMPMAQMAGYDPVLLDPRDSFASAARFPGQRILNDWPADAVAKIGLDTRTALVLLTHDPKLDDPVLEIALRSDAFYIGALGSKRTHAKRAARLEEAGFTSVDIARIHGPVGLDIGASSPSEIAVSIMAQITQVLRKGHP
ncbi:XdhC family protein [Planktotalea arctica]|uniref:XdhC family protein n=1 Tax=Planktotalea arctica TaxID=1481893 RepID=UPI000A1760D9|nr:XdhC/CoxI family protein [Planktotalea arctica]